MFKLVNRQKTVGILLVIGQTTQVCFEMVKGGFMYSFCCCSRPDAKSPDLFLSLLREVNVANLMHLRCIYKLVVVVVHLYLIPYHVILKAFCLLIVQLKVHPLYDKLEIALKPFVIKKDCILFFAILKGTSGFFQPSSQLCTHTCAIKMSQWSQCKMSPKSASKHLISWRCQRCFWSKKAWGSLFLKDLGFGHSIGTIGSITPDIKNPSSSPCCCKWKMATEIAAIFGLKDWKWCLRPKSISWLKSNAPKV